MNGAVLYINRFSSRCGGCGKGCDPYEATHDTVLGYGASQPGCGALYIAVSSDYTGMDDAATEMRPDLPWAEAL